jgi:hypothetical protein
MLKRRIVALVVALTLLAAVAGTSTSVVSSLTTTFTSDGQAVACSGQSGGGC